MSRSAAPRSACCRSGTSSTGRRPKTSPPESCATLERHTRAYTPFEIWFKALDEFFRGRELAPDAWDEDNPSSSRCLTGTSRTPTAICCQIADRFGGAFLCDGVGLGKTYVGLMLIERLVVKEGKPVVLFAPKAAREDVWEPALQALPAAGVQRLRQPEHLQPHRPAAQGAMARATSS